MDYTPNFLSALKKALLSYTSAPSWLVAYSGGMDSHALLFALRQLGREDDSLPPVRAVHIHHGLQANADSMQVHCSLTCHNLLIPFGAVSVDVVQQKGESVEAVARAARYGAISAYMRKEEVVFTAQHLDDQAETMLLQSLRGAGVKGLSAMPESTAFGPGVLARPLLSFSRDDLTTFAHENALSWIDDPSNDDLAFSRNYVRHLVMPAIKKRFPQSALTLSRSANHCANAQALLSEYVNDDLSTVFDEAERALCLEGFTAFSLAKQREVLRAYLLRLQLPLPSMPKLEHVLTDVVAAREDASPCVSWASVEVRRYFNKLYAFSPLAGHDVTRVFLWDLKAALHLPGGVLSVKPSEGGGLCLPSGAQVTVRFRRGGEQMVVPHRGRRSLKKLFQEWGVKPWLRNRVPLLYVNDTLATVVGYEIAPQFRASADSTGVELSLLAGHCTGI